jgi:NitT/TauT family transport system ATP-binding protein
MPSALSLFDIRKEFVTRRGRVEALAGVSIDVPADGFVAVVGPSGCGKSTLLQIAAGLDTDFRGEVSVPRGTRRAHLFQTPRLLPWLTVEENVAFVQKVASRREALATARHFVRLVGLAGFERQFPNHLSGGMQQRAALARALAVRPDVMLMDEPFASLDELTARILRLELLQLHRQSSQAVLFVTHNVTEAAFLADSVVVLSPRPGHVLAEIPVDLPRPREFDDPAVALVARTIFANLRLGSEALADEYAPLANAE